VSPLLAIVIVVVVVVVVAVVLIGRRRTDGVDSFRRQIDALSAESRRSTVDQVHDAARRRDQADEDDDPDEGGVRGS